MDKGHINGQMDVNIAVITEMTKNMDKAHISGWMAEST